MPSIKLTSANIRTLGVPEGKSEESYWDTVVPGLVLRVRKSGHRGLEIRYDFGGKPERMSMGSLAILDLGRARASAKIALSRVRLGENVAALKNENRQRASITFGSKLETYLTHKQNKLKPRSYLETVRHLNKHAKPLHPVPLERFEERNGHRVVADCLTKIAERNGPGASDRARAELSSYFVWLMQKGLVGVNPVINTGKASERGPRQHMPSDDELRAICGGLGDPRSLCCPRESWTVAEQYAVIAWLLLLTLARRDEVGSLRWSEVDFERMMITLPPERTKQKRTSKTPRPRHIPMVPLVADLLRAQPRRSCDLIFGHRDDRGWQDWGRAKKNLDARIQPPVRHWVLHDFRRLGSTILNERFHVHPWIVEMLLGHALGGISAVYNKSLHLEERRRALERWCDFILELTTGNETMHAI